MAENQPKAPRAPKGLGTRGRRFWRDTWADFELTDAETVILEEACRALDRLDALDETIKQDGMTTRGSAGQTIIHPAVQEARQQQLALHRLISALGLPDDEGEVMPSSGQLRSQVANRARWAGKDTEAARRRASGLKVV